MNDAPKILLAIQLVKELTISPDFT
jgi:hypothetical protein